MYLVFEKETNKQPVCLLLKFKNRREIFFLNLRGNSIEKQKNDFKIKGHIYDTMVCDFHYGSLYFRTALQNT